MESARTPSSFGEIRQDTAGRATFGSSVGVASATWAADSREWTTIGGQGCVRRRRRPPAFVPSTERPGKRGGLRERAAASRLLRREGDAWLRKALDRIVEDDHRRPPHAARDAPRPGAQTP